MGLPEHEKQWAKENKLRVTDMTVFEYGKRRKVYVSKVTGKLYFRFRNTYFLTFKEYCDGDGDGMKSND